MTLAPLSAAHWTPWATVKRLNAPSMDTLTEEMLAPA
jgi:hypothetical protein